jgi:hypothetical protein
MVGKGKVEMTRNSGQAERGHTVFLSFPVWPQRIEVPHARVGHSHNLIGRNSKYIEVGEGARGRKSIVELTSRIVVTPARHLD